MTMPTFDRIFECDKRTEAKKPLQVVKRKKTSDLRDKPKKPLHGRLKRGIPAFCWF